MITRNLKVLMLLFANLVFVVFPSCLYAGDYPIIIPDGYTFNGVVTSMHFSQQVVDVGPASEQTIPAGNVVRIAYRYTHSDTDVFSTMVVTSDGKTPIGKLAMKVYAHDGALTVLNSNVSRHFDPDYFCIGYMGLQTSNTFMNAVVPGGCQVFPPTDQWCKITTPELLIDHGTITLQDAEGDTASTNMGVSCSSDMTVSFNLITADKYVYLDDGQSEIKVANLPLSSPIDLKSGDSVLNVSDLLTGVTTEGLHTGSSVLVMEPY